MTTLLSYKKCALLCLTFVVCLMFPEGNSYPAETSAKILVTATVQSRCLINTGTIQFGIYDPTGNNYGNGVSAQGDISIQCTRNTNAKITIDNGSNRGRVQSTSRAMKGSNGDSYLGYDIYKDSAKSEKWGDVGSVNYDAKTSSITKFPVYAYIPADQQVPNGNYSDVVTITVTY